jgi:hypothetical protein
MKYILVLILVLLSVVSFPQNFTTGTWKGKILMPESDIKVHLNIMEQRDTIVHAVLFEPTMCLLYDSCFYGNDLNLKSSKKDWAIRNKNTRKKGLQNDNKAEAYQEIRLSGSLAANKNQFNGELLLEGKIFPIELFRDNKPISRPQEPQRPYPYYCEDVRIRNKKDSVVLAGTLTLPDKEGKFPVVILQGGSIPGNRDGDSNHHKLFLVLADYLTRNGIAALRYDERGIGRSSGNFYKSTPLNLAGDLHAWRGYLGSREEIINNQIGIIGFSEGGMVAAMAASQCPDFNFILMLGAPGLPLRDVFEKQSKLYLESGEMKPELYEQQQKATQKIYEMMKLNFDSKMMTDSLLKSKKTFIHQYFDSIANDPMKRYNTEMLYSEMISMRVSPHNLFNLQVNPSDYIEKVTCPVLSLNGSNDRQVTPKDNQQAIRQALIRANNNDYQIIELEGLNHSFQECEKGTITEALTIEQTFSPKALDIITKWILKHTKNEKQVEP